MKVVLALFVLVPGAAFANANQCKATAPAVECIEYIYKNTSLDRIGAAKACRGGVDVSCVEYMYKNTSLDRIGAANACRGGVDVSCIDYMYKNTSLDRIGAAKACAGE